MTEEWRTVFLADVSAILSSSLDYETTLQRVAHLVVPRLADWCSIDVVEADGTVRQLVVEHRDPSMAEHVRSLRSRFSPDPAQPSGILEVLRTGQPHLASDITDAMLVAVARDAAHLELLRAVGFSSLMIVPLMARDHILGALSLVTAESGRRYGMDDLALAEEMARRAAVAVDNARLYREAEAARARAERLQAVTVALSAALTPNAVARAIVEEGLPAFQADAGAVYTLEDGASLVLLGYAGYAKEVEPGYARVSVDRPGPLAEAVQSGDLVVVESAVEMLARWPHLAAAQAESGDAATAAAPLLGDGRVLGVLYLAFRQPRRFNADDRAFLMTLARQCAQALDRARLYAAEQAAQRAATAHADELEAIVDAIADGVCVYDGEGRITRVNSTARALAALDPASDYLTRPLHERISMAAFRDEQGRPLAREQWPQLRALAGEVLTGQNAMEIRTRALNGYERFMSVSGAPIRNAAGQIVGAICIYRDVTERRRLERRTRDALDALLAMAQLLVQPSDEEDETAESAAGAVGQRLVELIRDVLGCRRASIISIEPRSGVRHPLAIVGLSVEDEQIWRTTLDGRPLSESDPALVSRIYAGEVFVVDMSQPPWQARPNPLEVRTMLVAPMQVGGELVGILSLDYGGAVHEYTPDELNVAEAVARLAALTVERARLLREREEARTNARALREANRRMDEFLGVASHELRTPLTGIRGSLQVLQRRLDRAMGESEVTAADVTAFLGRLSPLLDRAIGQSSVLNELVSDLLDLSRIQAGQMQLHLVPCDLVGLVRQAVEEQHELAPARTIHLETPRKRKIYVQADASRLAQVVTNYLTNALKYSDADQPVTVGVEVSADTARVWVHDEGVGVPLADQELIWDRFHRVAGSGHRSGSSVGLGLGLYISRTIVERHHGQVGVQSTPGQGATFWFTLPLSK